MRVTKSNIKIVLIAATILALWLIGFRCGRSGRVVKDTPVVVLDTSGTFEPVTGDTSIPLIKRPFEAKVTPQKIIAHPLIRDTTKPREFAEAIVRLDYNAPDLKFSSFVLESGTVDTFKTYFFPGVGSRFRIRPTPDGFTVIRRKQFFSRKDLILGYSLADGAFVQGDLAVSRVGVRAEISASGREAKADLRGYYTIW